ncbi:4-carboxymuconolactone decarboxylase [Pseudomonas cuatrocienegasensis]|uniref:4-carboxymuconolactone decarboxylase n=1 Tax=Pseudomonas cuatrocienegasensis TaxID=543360 RepID=A0ABY1BBE3_9PSED|nr:MULTISPECIES: carboxymuconolactone decarboxylase family protein [Pseudomonas]SEQ44606.1 4-carboxymuconolactone decarboxylase [Pseudomonas cuatrocienegasensis]
MTSKKLSVVTGLLLSAIAIPASAAEPDNRRVKGVETLERITGTAGNNVVKSLSDISPELGEWIVDFAYGDVFSRPGVALCTRELATIAALTALGNAQPQLKVHIEGALNVGCKPEEIVEIIIQMAVYAGFPSALNGISAAREVFAKRGIKIVAPPPE